MTISKKLLVPQTYLGKLSLILIISFFLLQNVFLFLVTSGQRGGEKFFDNPYLALPVSLSAVCGVSAFIGGVLAIILKKERSIIVFLSTIFGFFIFLFVLGELLFPHGPN